MLPGRIVFCGDAALNIQNDKAMDAFMERIRSLKSDAEIICISSVPEAADIAALALEAYEAGVAADPFTLKAEYISPSQAERMNALKDDRVVISEASADDLDLIVKIENDSFTMPWSRGSIEQDLLSGGDRVYLVARVNDETAGYIGVHMVYEDAQIVNIAVAQTFRRKGTGRLLIRNACEHCRRSGCTKIHLEVRAGNASAKSLYISEGFQTIGTRKRYYEDNGETAIIMLKYL